MKTLRDPRGQAMVLSVAFLAVLLGMASLVVDVGAWYRADRAAQTTADAAALAAAQGLNESPAKALALAVEYGDKNGGDVGPADVAISSSTVKVTVTRETPGFFAKLFGIHTVDVRATAAARIGPPAQALGVAPIVVNEKHPDLMSFGKATELTYYNLKSSGGSGGPSSDGAGSFGFINLDNDGTNPATSTLGDWIRNGFDKYMDTGSYSARTGNPFTSTHVEESLQGKIGETLLFPVYRTLTESGATAKYLIVGWVGFEVTGVSFSGSDQKLYGKFTRFIAQGIQGKAGGTVSPGVGVVQLVE